MQKLFKMKDGEKIVSAISLDSRVIGNITEDPKHPDYCPEVHGFAATSNGYALRFGLQQFVEPSTRSGRKYARVAPGAEVVGVESLGATEGFPLYRPTMRFSPTPGETVDRAAAETYRPTTVGERIEVGFDPQNIDDVRLMDIRDRWLSPVWMLIFGVVTLAIAMYRWRNPAPDPSGDG